MPLPVITYPWSSWMTGRPFFGGPAAARADRERLLDRCLALEQALAIAQGEEEDPAEVERGQLREALADLVGDLGTGFCPVPGCSGDDYGDDSNRKRPGRAHKCSLPAARALLAQLR